MLTYWIDGMVDTMYETTDRTVAPYTTILTIKLKTLKNNKSLLILENIIS